MKKSELIKRIEMLERQVALLELQVAAQRVTEYVPYPVYPQPYYPYWPYSETVPGITYGNDVICISTDCGTTSTFSQDGPIEA